VFSANSVEWGVCAGVVAGQTVLVIDREQDLRLPGEGAARSVVDAAGPTGPIADPRLLELWLSALSEVDNVAGKTAMPSSRTGVRRRLELSVSTEMKEYPAAGRLAVLTLVLCAVQAGIWDGPLGDGGWIRVVGNALAQLDQGDVPDGLSVRMASWAALATYLMHENRPTTGRTGEALLYEKAADSVSHLFPDADAQLVAELAAPFTNGNGFPVDPDAVMHVISMVVQADPLSEAIDLLEANHPAWQIHRHSAVLLHVNGEFRGTFLPAAEALDAIPGVGIAAVLATGTTDGWTLAIRDQDSLIRVEKNPNGQLTWWHYSLTRLVTATGIARDHELANRLRQKYRRLDEHFPAALAALAKAEIDLSTDPLADCPELVLGGCFQVLLSVGTRSRIAGGVGESGDRSTFIWV